MHSSFLFVSEMIFYIKSNIELQDGEPILHQQLYMLVRTLKPCKER